MSSLAQPCMAAPGVSALLVSPFANDRSALAEVFSRSNWNLLTARNCEEAVALMRSQAVPVVICDGQIRDSGWRTLLEAAGQLLAPSRVIVCSRHADDALWAEVLHQGGYSVMMTPFDDREVVAEVSMAAQSWAAQSWNHSRGDSVAGPQGFEPAATRAEPAWLPGS